MGKTEEFFGEPPETPVWLAPILRAFWTCRSRHLLEEPIAMTTFESYLRARDLLDCFEDWLPWLDLLDSARARWVAEEQKKAHETAGRRRP